MKKELFEKVVKEIEMINEELKNDVNKINENVASLEKFIDAKIKNEKTIIEEYENALDTIRYSRDTEEIKVQKRLLLNKEKKVDKTNAYKIVNVVEKIASKVYEYYNKVFDFLLDNVGRKTTNLIFKYCDAKRDYTQIKNYVDENYQTLYFRFYNDYDNIDFIYNNCSKVDTREFSRRLRAYMYISKLTEYDKNYNDVFTDNSFKVAKRNFKDFEIKELTSDILDYQKAYENAEQVYLLQQKHAQEKADLEQKQSDEMKALNKLCL